MRAQEMKRPPDGSCDGKRCRELHVSDPDAWAAATRFDTFYDGGRLEQRTCLGCGATLSRVAAERCATCRGTGRARSSSAGKRELTKTCPDCLGTGEAGVDVESYGVEADGALAEARAAVK